MTPRSGSNGPHRGAGRPPGIIDTVGNAFALLNRRPYLIWMPILLDVLLWSGFRVSVADPLSWSARNLSSMPPSMDALVDEIRVAVTGADVIGLAVSLVPTLLTDLNRGEIPELASYSGISVSGSTSFLALAVSVLVGVVVGMTYFTLVGRLVNDVPAWGMRFLSDCIVNAYRLCVLMLMVIALLAFLLLPFLALGVGLAWAGFDPTTFLVMVAGIVTLWALIFFGFSVHAISVGVARPVEALRSSYLMVHRNLLPMLGLLAILFVIRAGTPIVLEHFTKSQWSIPFAIVANAYIGTALVAATMLFYRDRRPTIDYANASESSG